MRFSSFIAITAAGFAVALPIVPGTTEKQLTVEPAEVYKRQSTVSTVTDLAQGGSGAAGSLPALPKRQVPDLSSLPTGLLPRQLPGLGGLVPGSDSNEGEEVEPKEPKEPSSVAGDATDDTEDDLDDTTEDGTEAATDDTAASTASDPASALGGGLPLAKRQIPSLPGAEGLSNLKLPGTKRQLPGGLGSLLGMGDKDTPAPANATAAAAADDAAATPTETADEATETTPAATPSTSAAAAPAGGLGGILKRQLNGLLGGDDSTNDAPAADDEGDATTTGKEQVSNVDDGTNGSATPTPTATPTPAPAKGGLGGLIPGM